MFSLDDPAFSKVSPFHIVWDGSGEVIRISGAAQRYFYGKEIEGKHPAIELFEPYASTLDVGLLPELTRMTLHVGVASAPSRALKGELMPLEMDGGGWIFSGIPPLENIRSLEDNGVSLRDMPLHMGVTEFLLANEALQASLAESREKNSHLEEANRVARRQRRELELRSQQLAKEAEEHQAVSRDLERALGELQGLQAALVQHERIKALGDMVSGIAHDFNNILTPILSYAVLLKEEKDMPEEEREQFLDWIYTAACDAAEVIKRLRNIYKPDFDPLQFQDFNVARVVEDALVLAESQWRSDPSVGNREIRIERDLDRELTLFGAGAEIRQALLSLFTNAGDAMPEGGVLSVSCTSSDEGIRIEVRDTGCGMDETLLRQCRNPLHSSKGRRAKGMGLPLVFGAALRHNGRVEVESTLGVGSSFTLVLRAGGVYGASGKPRADENASSDGDGWPNELDDWAEESSSVSDRPAPRPSRNSKTRIRDFSTIGQRLDGRLSGMSTIGIPPSELASLRVLIVDDDPMTRKTLERAVSAMGMPYQIADDGEEALTLIELGHPFDLVITDVDMPNLRGDELASLARSLLSDCVIVLFTGRPESISDAGEQAANLILLKPLDARDVIRVCLELITEIHPKHQLIG